MTARWRVVARGRVQGVGFRWHVLDCARAAGVSGWVRNSPDGSVELEAQGDARTLGEFLEAVRGGHPYARVASLERAELPAAAGEEGFEIRH